MEAYSGRVMQRFEAQLRHLLAPLGELPIAPVF